MMTTNWATSALTDGEKPRAVGTYAVGEPITGGGIRRYPYSTNMAIDPLTYASMDGTATGGEVHNIGEIWCSALWDMTWNIIKETGVSTPAQTVTAPNGAPSSLTGSASTATNINLTRR